MRIFSLILLMVMFFATSITYGGSNLGPGLIIFVFTYGPGFAGFPHKKPPPRIGRYWFKPGTDDIEQLKQDYRECTTIKSFSDWYKSLIDGEAQCMEARGYFEWPPRGEGFWYQDSVSTEKLKQDYGECRGKNHGWPCMEAKGYAWKYNGSGYWYKAGVDIEQLKHDYRECKAKGEVRLCMEENGYIRVPFSLKRK